MKKIIYTFTAFAFVVAVFFSACKSPSEKVEDSAEKVEKAKTDLDEAEQDYAQNIEAFRKESNDKITANEKSIAELNARIAKEKKQANSDYKSRVAVIEKRNSDMRRKLDDYKSEGKENWESFKIEFNRDMDELGNSLKDLTNSSKLN